MSAGVSPIGRFVSRRDFFPFLVDPMPPKTSFSPLLKVKKEETLELLKIYPKLRCEISDGFLRETIETIESNICVISLKKKPDGELINRNHSRKLHRTIIIDQLGRIYISCKRHSHFSEGVGRGNMKNNTFLINITDAKVMTLGSSKLGPTEHADYNSGQIYHTHERQQCADREALAATLFKGVPNIIQYHDVFNYDGGGIFPECKQAIIMDYYSEGSLVDITNDYLTGQLMFNLDQMYRFVRSICNGLIYLHEKGYIHRDVKPDNYLIKKFEENGVTYYEADLTDFGFFIHQDDKAKLDDSVGTIPFVAPEFWKFYHELRVVMHGLTQDSIKSSHFNKITTAADVYSLGVYFCQLFLNHHPPKQGIQSYCGDPWLRALKEPVDKPLEHLLWRMTRKNPKVRPTMVQVLEELKPALEHFYSTKP